MNAGVAAAALAVVSVATAVIGFYGLRISRTTGDFYVASRTVRPWWNASAIGGEYLSAASFLGVAGLILLSGTDALWFPVGYTAGYLMLLLFVAAPLRRSGAYTIPDFTEARLDSRAVRKVTSLVVVLVGWLYIVPQLHGAALTIRITTGLPSWVGSVAVVVVVCLTVVAGGMRSITFVQAFQYWLKLTALAVPILFILFVLAGTGYSPVAAPAVNPTGQPPASLYSNVSLLVALLFGTLGLPHVLVRFYTNPDGQSARRTTLIVLGLLSVFYLFPTAYGLVGRMFAPELGRSGQPDAMVLLLPRELVGGAAGDLLAALVVAGAFAAFLSTTSGLVVSLAGVVSQDVLGAGVGGFRLAAVVSAVVPLGFALMTDSLALAGSVGLVFAFTASTVCPVLLLGIWWRGLTDAGAIAGMVTGGLLCGGAMIAGSVAGAANTPAWLAQPAAWSVPTAFAVMVLVSRATAGRVPATLSRVMTRLHTPERPLATGR
ncbi:Na+(or H+)/acetate symporter ActP [Pseudarthrobacter enclensis]|uniref:Cation acetate symporter n=1 Tax=Pseudarthrobacter enclensis TaxID=993070 RepID=A0A0V8ID58_9MICC|nr:cation acetate symporter [Pseudarthrobacter enclensis]KSU72722.1 cation acetate symporter [Pseudarthrobacter enclensis]SCC23095.1 Na+(or H+)/acetate symporter ActP [Pseudarthrobacter enclensis]